MKQEYVNGVIEWRKFVPKNWHLFRFRYLFTLGRGINITKADLQDEGLPCVTYGDIHSRYGFELNPNEQVLRCVGDENLTSAENSMLRKGDFIFADTSEDIAGSGNFTYLNSETETVAGYHTVIARPKNRESSRFLAYLFDSITFRTQIRSRVYGIKVFSITQAILKDTIVPMPPTKEQKAIVAHLDRRTAEIDEMLANLQSQADQLHRYKRELIADAVTHGIDKTVSHKNSGVDWIGDVPSHWKLFRFRHLFRFGRGISITKADLQDEGLPCVTYGDIHSRYGFELNPNEQVLRCVGDEYLKSAKDSMLRKGDFIFADTSEDLEGSGNFTYLNSEADAIAGYHTIIARPKNPESSRFIAYLFDSIPFRTQIRSRVCGTKVFSITQAILKDTIVLVPPIEEQKKIATYLDMKTSQVDTLTADINKQIEKLKQYRQIVIHDAVTGKIKVKETQDNGN